MQSQSLLASCRSFSCVKTAKERGEPSVTENRLRKNSVQYMLLTRCGYNAEEFFDVEDFRDIYNFNTIETLNILGCAGSDISEMVLQEIAETVKAAERESKKKNRTFASPDKTEDNISENKATERSTQNGTDLQTGGRLSSAQHPSAGQPEDREIWNAAPHISKESQKNDAIGASTDGQAERTSGTDRGIAHYYKHKTIAKKLRKMQSKSSDEMP